MQFIDEAKIHIKSGAGGPGCVSFRREANVPRGGPNGGDGGTGGSVIIKTVPGLNTLIDYRFQQHFKAKNGEHGKGKDMHGASAPDIILQVPVGTQIYDEDGETLLADLDQLDQSVVLAEGGKGGLGNTNFKSSINQAPRKATSGEPGLERTLWLKLKLLSDAGLVGLPNAGKSTFLSVVSRAKPKIADYPFTTLAPQLGVVYTDEKEFVLADLPGLIEGAHEGAGLGDRFLKHIERCGVLLHLVDATQEDIETAYHTIRAELEGYGHGVAEKHELLALTKVDALLDEEIAEKKAILEACSGKTVAILSSQSGLGVTEAKRALWAEIKQFREEQHLRETGPIATKPYSPI